MVHLFQRSISRLSRFNFSSFRNGLTLCMGLGLLNAPIALAQEQAALGQHDGPYIHYAAEGAKIYEVRDYKLQVSDFKREPFWVTTDNGQHRFQVALHAHKIPDWKHKSKGDIMVLSDPHGDFESLYAVLKAQQVVGDSYEWTYGKNHLVIIGDVFDRGVDVLPIFWLIYKLEAEAARAGGKVHFLFGNHEEMILRGNLKYAEGKYQAFADAVGIPQPQLWSTAMELGRWLQSRNSMEKIGDKLFVHAGLSKELLDARWSIPMVNDTVRAYIAKPKAERELSAAAKFIFGSNGPLWYRGMVHQDEKYNPLAASDAQQLLNFYQAKQLFVGHTIFPEVSSFYNKTVYAVNVKNKVNRAQGLSRGLLIKKGKVFLIYDDPSQNKPMN